jgi:hypothetical protein
MNIMLDQSTYDHMKDMAVRKAVMDYYHKYIFYTPIAEWPKELKVKAVELTGNFRAVKARVDKGV